MRDGGRDGSVLGCVSRSTDEGSAGSHHEVREGRHMESGVCIRPRDWLLCRANISLRGASWRGAERVGVEDRDGWCLVGRCAVFEERLASVCPLCIISVDPSRLTDA
jgi:hypothetical protein